MATNPFENYTYSFGGWGMSANPWDKTSIVNKTQLATRAGNETPIECASGYLGTTDGYKINAYFLKSLHKNSNNQYDDLLLPNSLYFKETLRYIEIPFGTKYVCITVSKNDNTVEFTSAEVASLYRTAFEYIPSARTYSLDGSIAVGEYSNDVLIKNIREKYPSYNDDQLLDEAIKIAKVKTNGRAAKIIWDGRDIYFAGNIQHDCYGFGGIDFNGARIYMPDYDTDLAVDYPPAIINVLPDSYSDIVASASDFTKYNTTNASLQNKIFTINDNYTGNTDMCIGDRVGHDTAIYYSPTMVTMPSGEFYGSNLYLVPESGDVPCYNVHEYPDVTFEISNAIVMTRYSTTNMSCLVQCSRSNVHLHGFTLLNSRPDVSTYHSRYLFSFKRCTDIEIDHVCGINPIHSSAGYVFALSSVTNLHVHDCRIGDMTKWGAFGGNHITNSTFERCDSFRWDCHYAQYGCHIIKDCNLNCIAYGGAGYGMIIIEKCTFTMRPVNSSAPIMMRGDTVAVFDGDIIVRDCIFEQGTATLSNFGIWTDGTINQKPENSKITGAPKRQRILDNCEIPEGILRVFRIGTSVQADRSMYSNLTYKIKDCTISCSEGVFVAPGANQTIKEVILEGCTIGNCLTTKNIVGCNIRASNCDLVTIDSDVTLPKLIANGNTFSGTQSVSNFTDYALSGNIAADMASVNKHS